MKIENREQAIVTLIYLSKDANDPEALSNLIDFIKDKVKENIALKEQVKVLMGNILI